MFLQEHGQDQHDGVLAGSFRFLQRGLFLCARMDTGRNLGIAGSRSWFAFNDNAPQQKRIGGRFSIC